MTIKKYLTCLAASILIAPSVLAQMTVPMTPGQYMGSKAIGVLGDLALSIGALARANRAIEEELVAARRVYFDTPDGPARAEPGRKFEEAMMKRDLHFVVSRIINTSRREAPLLALVNGAAGSNVVDGGISPYASESFGKWADDVINAASRHGTLEKALQGAMPQFEKYRVERDIVEELFHNPHSVLSAKDPKPSEYLAAWILGTKYATSFATANAAAAKIVRDVGPQRLAEIVQVLRSWSVVDNHIHTQSGWNPASALDALVAGNPGAPTAFDATAHRTEFLEFRGDLSRWNEKLVPQLNEFEQAWNTGRVSKDAGTLRLALSKRDELVQMIDAARARNPSNDTSGWGKLLESRLNVSFGFVDRAIQAGELDAMKRGDMYSLDIKKQQPVVAARSGARRGASTPTSSAAPEGSQAAPPAASSAVAISSATDTDSPLDRLVAIAGNPALQDFDARARMLNLAKQWEYLTGAAADMPPNVVKKFYMDTKTNLESEIGRQQNQLDSLAQLQAKMPPAQRTESEKYFARANELRKEFITELQAAIPRVEKAIATQKP